MTTEGDYRGLSMKEGHYNARSKCLTIFSKSYKGTLPLIYTHVKVSYDSDSYYH